MDLSVPLIEQQKEVEVVFKDLKYTLYKGEKLYEKQILKGVTGFVPPNKLTAIFGPTGAGKTTLLDCLARRKNLKWVEGGIYVNGIPQATGFKRMSGYVVQEDILLGMMTVRENILFSARLRLPSEIYTRVDRERLVDEVISELALSKCKDTLVGNELVRGISGGERKRTNIGCELVMRPKVLFLDECTSGLDSATAVQVIQSIRELCSKGTTVAMSIHQPRFSIFKLLDHIILLSDGKIIYQGDTHDVIPHFADCGYICEQNNNPADFMFDALSGLVIKQNGERYLDDVSSVEDGTPVISYEYESKSAHTTLLKAYETSAHSKKITVHVDEIIGQAINLSPSSTKKQDIQSSASYGVNSFQQFIILSERYLINIRRMPIILIAQMVVMLIFAGRFYRIRSDNLTYW